MNKRMENSGKNVMKLDGGQLRQAASEFPTQLPRPAPSDQRRQYAEVSKSESPVVPLNTQFVFQMTANLQPPLVIEGTPRGTRQIIFTTGGELVGPAVTGELLPGTADWPLFRADGVAEIEPRVTVRLDDGQLVYVSYAGYFIASAEVWERILTGETVAPSDYYFRVTMRFETGSEQHAWLNQIMAVGVGEVGPGFIWVSYRVYQVL